MNDIMLEISSRLKEYRTHLGLSQSAFAKKLGIPQSTYSKYELGSDISTKTLVSLYDLGINLNWLLMGKEELQINTKMVETNYDLNIPVIASKVSAGSGEEWRDEDFLEGQMVPITKDLIKGHDVKKIFAAQVKGDSMIDAMIFDGDYVFAVKDEIRGDGIYILSVDGEVLVKRLEYDAFEHKVNVISANKAYQPRTVDEDRIIILGKVIGWLHHHPF